MRIRKKLSKLRVGVTLVEQSENYLGNSKNDDNRKVDIFNTQ